MTEERAAEVAMVVESVRVHMPTGRHVLLLKEIGLGRVLPIWIGQWEASAIATHLQGVEPERPLTHDLLVTALRATGWTLERVVIVRLAAETFHARIRLVAGDERRVLDARPSDAVALALRVDAPIYASQAVLDQAATSSDRLEEDAPARPARPRRERPLAGPPPAEAAPGEPIDPARLDLFREFVNSLDPEDEGRARSG